MAWLLVVVVSGIVWLHGDPAATPDAAGFVVALVIVFGLAGSAGAQHRSGDP